MRRITLVLALVLMATPPVCPEALVVTQATLAEVFTGDDGVRVELEIGPSDLPARKNLVPDEIFERKITDFDLQQEQRLPS